MQHIGSAEWKTKFNTSAKYKKYFAINTGPSQCGAQCKTWPRDLMQELGMGLLLAVIYMTSSCSVNRVTIVVERRYTVQH